MPDPKFKVGDKVRALDEHLSHAVGVVTSVTWRDDCSFYDPDNPPSCCSRFSDWVYEVRYSYGGWSTTSRRECELVLVEHALPFAVGDYVHVPGYDGPGRVLVTDGRPGVEKPYVVACEDGTVRSFYATAVGAPNPKES